MELQRKHTPNTPIHIASSIFHQGLKVPESVRVLSWTVTRPTPVYTMGAPDVSWTIGYPVVKGVIATKIDANIICFGSIFDIHLELMMTPSYSFIMVFEGCKVETVYQGPQPVNYSWIAKRFRKFNLV